MIRPPAPAPGAALALLLLAAACGNPGGDPTLPPTVPDPPGPRPGTVRLPADPDAVFLEVWWHPGFVPEEISVGRPPLIWLQASGHIVVQGPVPEIYPGPIVLPLLTGRLDDRAMNEVVAAIAATDLPGGGADIHIDDLANRIADASTHQFRLNEANGSRSIWVYALGFEEIATDRRVAALLDLLDVLGSASEVATEPYYDGRMQVISLGVRGFHDPDFVNEHPWPLPVAPEAPDRWACHEFEGAAADAVYAAFRGKNHAARWLHEGQGYQLVARPLLPEEPGCANFE